MYSKANKQFKLSEVALHNTKASCWMVIHGSVYDLTEYIDLHPGMDEMVIGCGTDASYLYDTRNGIGHSSRADEILKKYYIGDLQYPVTP